MLEDNKPTYLTDTCYILAIATVYTLYQSCITFYSEY